MTPAPPTILRRPRVEAVANAVCTAYWITRAELRSATHAWRYRDAKQVAYLLTRELCGASYSEIGQWFGGKHPTSIIHSIDVARRKMQESELFRSSVEEIRAKILEGSSEAAPTSPARRSTDEMLRDVLVILGGLREDVRRLEAAGQ